MESRYDQYRRTGRLHLVHAPIERPLELQRPYRGSGLTSGGPSAHARRPRPLASWSRSGFSYLALAPYTPGGIHNTSEVDTGIWHFEAPRALSRYLCMLHFESQHTTLRGGILHFIKALLSTAPKRVRINTPADTHGYQLSLVQNLTTTNLDNRLPHLVY